MPYVLNGVGTWNYGKKNKSFVESQCEFCNYEGNLTSYDTRTFFVVLFIPIIPLGAKRVLNECPHCKKYRHISLKKWNNLKEEEILSSINQLKTTKLSTDAAIELLHKIVAYQDPLIVFQIGPLIQKKYSNDSKVLATLGSLYRLYHKNDLSEQCFRDALKVENSNDIKEELAITLINLKRPKEAEAQLEHIIATSDKDGINLLMYNVEGYQALGMHNEALTLLDKLEATFPDIEKNSQFKAFKKNSIKDRETHSKIYSDRIETSNTPIDTNHEELSKAPLLVLPLLILLALSALAFIAFNEGKNREVFLVNGLNKSYEISINDKQYTLAPFQKRKVNISEGDVTIKNLDNTLPLAEQKCKIKTPFYLRPFINKTFVINPDKLAFILWQETTYYVNVESAPAYQDSFHYYTGDLLYEIGGLDYKFEDIPSTISMEGNSEKRFSINVSPNTKTIDDRYELAAQIFNKEELIRYLTAELSYNKNHINAISTYSKIVSPEVAIKFYKENISTKPVLVNLHRSYQDFMDYADPDHNLINEYDELLKTDPNNSNYLYLMGRIDDNNAEKYYQKAISTKSPNAYAYNALAWIRLAEGSFKEALTYAQKAVSLAPENDNFTLIKEECCASNKQYNQIVNDLIQKINIDSFNINLHLKTIAYMVKTGQKEQINNLIDAYYKRLESAKSPYAESNRKYLNAFVAYFKGKKNEFANLSKDIESLNFVRAVWCEDPSKAHSSLIETQNSDPYDNLLVYMKAKLNKEQDIAKTNLETAIKKLKEMGKAERTLASMFETGTFSLKDVKALEVWPAQKSVALAALGVRSPKKSKECYQLSKKLNYSPFPPYQTLESIYN